MSRIRTTAAIAATAAALLVAGAGPALAAGPGGADFARHVIHCQRHMGLDGDHNPGVMHRGFAGWDPAHAC